MRRFKDPRGREWVATVREEVTPRHHGRWYLVLEPADGKGPALPMPEVRWQSPETAERTLRTMGEHELQRRAGWLVARAHGPARGEPAAS